MDKFTETRLHSHVNGIRGKSSLVLCVRTIQSYLDAIDREKMTFELEMCTAP